MVLVLRIIAAYVTLHLFLESKTFFLGELDLCIGGPGRIEVIFDCLNFDAVTACGRIELIAILALDVLRGGTFRVWLVVLTITRKLIPVHLRTCTPLRLEELPRTDLVVAIHRARLRDYGHISRHDVPMLALAIILISRIIFWVITFLFRTLWIQASTLLGIEDPVFSTVHFAHFHSFPVLELIDYDRV